MCFSPLLFKKTDFVSLSVMLKFSFFRLFLILFKSFVTFSVFILVEFIVCYLLNVHSMFWVLLFIIGIILFCFNRAKARTKNISKSERININSEVVNVMPLVVIQWDFLCLAWRPNMSLKKKWKKEWCFSSYLATERGSNLAWPCPNSMGQI